MKVRIWALGLLVQAMTVIPIVEITRQIYYYANSYPVYFPWYQALGEILFYWLCWLCVPIVINLTVNRIIERFKINFTYTNK